MLIILLIIIIIINTSESGANNQELEILKICPVFKERNLTEIAYAHIQLNHDSTVSLADYNE
jgi:hypothetical protein